MNNPAPTLKPNFDQRSLLAEIAGHGGQTPQLDHVCAAINHQLRHQTKVHLPTLERTHDVNTIENSELGLNLQSSFSAATMMQLHPGKKKKDLTKEEQNYVSNTASLNITAATLLANANQLTTQTLGGLFRNTTIAVDTLMNTLNTASRNNLNNTMRRQASNNSQDPNSPAALLSAMQNGDGSLLVNILRDSAAAALVDNNIEAAVEQQHELQIQTEEQQVENDQAQNLVTNENNEAATLQEITQETHHTALATPKPHHTTKKDEDEDNEQELEAQADNLTDNTTTSTHHLADAIRPLEALAEKGVEHAALKGVSEVAKFITAAH